uniref:Uncharacterized protein n=1 Tax=Phlebotomus papatasi TaxID=29031 RepID=A0A1B0D3A6_PHLPP
ENDSCDSFPSQLAAYLRVAPKNSNSQNTNTSDSQDSGPGEPLIAPEDIKKSPSSSPAPKQVSTSTGPKTIPPRPSSTPTSKISLVPTNILLKPQAQKVALKPSHTIFMKNPTTGAVSAIPSVANSTTGMPMKVLLVNTMPKSTASTPTIISKASQVFTQAATTVTTNSEPRQVPITARRMSSWKPPKPATIGFRTLLSQVIQQQTLSLEVAKERLAVEKERLSFEKATGEKLLEVLPLLQTISDHLTGRRTSQRIRKPVNSITHDSDD